MQNNFLLVFCLMASLSMNAMNEKKRVVLGDLVCEEIQEMSPELLKLYRNMGVFYELERAKNLVVLPLKRKRQEDQFTQSALPAVVATQRQVVIDKENQIPA